MNTLALSTKPRQVGLWLMLAALLVNGCVIAFSALNLQGSYNEKVHKAEVETQNLAKAMDHGLSSSVDKIDLAITNLVLELETQFKEGKPDPVYLLKIIDHQRSFIPEAVGIRVIDAEGRLRLGRGVITHKNAHIEDRDYFEYLRMHADAGLYVTRPVISNFADQRVVVFLRRYNKPDGRFAGVVSIPVEIAYFDTVLSRFEVGTHGATAMRASDLSLIARYPHSFQGKPLDLDKLMVSPELKSLADSGEQRGTYRSRTAIDGQQRIFTFHRLPKVPIFVVAGLAEQDFLQSWYLEVKQTVIFLLLFAAVSSLSCFLLYRFWLRQIEDTHALQRSHALLQQALNEIVERDEALMATQKLGMLGTYVYDSHRQVFATSAELEMILGIDADYPHTPEGWYQMVHADDRSMLERYMQQVVAGDQPFDLEYRIVRPQDGCIRWIHGYGKLVRDAEQQRLHMSGVIIDVTARKEHQLEMQRYAQIVAISGDMLLSLDEARCVLAANPAFLDYVGKSETDVHEHLNLQDMAPSLYEALADHLAAGYAGQPQRFNCEQRQAGGDRRILDCECRPIEEDGRVRGLVVSLRDVTDFALAEEELRLAREAFDNAQEALIVTDAQAHILSVNPAFTQITGYTRAEAQGRNPRFLDSGMQEATFFRKMWDALQEEGRWEGEFLNKRKDGRLYIQSAKITAVRDERGEITRYVGMASDVTQLRESQRRVEHLAYFDKLTDLPNRSLLTDRLKQAIALCDRRREMLGVCYLDLDGFKPINDTWGHETGDQALVEVARRLQSCVRNGDTVARLGGDEFIVLLCNARQIAEMETAIKRMLGLLGQGFKINGSEVELTASIGVAIYPDDVDDADTLIRHADQAMYIAKKMGKNCFHVFDSASDRRLKAQFEAFARVSRAVEQKEFVLEYQPKVNMRSGEVFGVEALIRWMDPELGMVMPNAFIATVEDTECAIDLGEWVLNEALSQMERWAEEGLHLQVGINIFGHHLLQGDFVSHLERALVAHPKVDPSLLQLEILETTVMDDVETVCDIMYACLDLGVSFALDDFGTGYSSLTSFRHLPTQVLKIDQSFVRDMLEDVGDAALVQGVIALAKSFKREVVAEGVETIEHGLPLLRSGCELAQGFGIARAMPATEIPGWVRSWKKPPEWELPPS